MPSEEMIFGLLLAHRNFPHTARCPTTRKAWAVFPPDRILIFPRRELTECDHFFLLEYGYEQIVLL